MSDTFPMHRSFGVILAAGLLLAALPANAQTFDPRYPVCMHVYSGASGGGGDWYDCSFISVPQCQATAAGRAAACDLNPYYAAMPRPRPRRHG